MNTVVNTLHIDAKEPIEILLGRRFYRSDMRNPGVVYEDFDFSFCEDLLKCFEDLPLLGNITRMSRRLSASVHDLLRCHLCLSCVDIHDSNCGSTRGKAQGNRLSDTAPAACNNGRLAVQTEMI
jgi:hypothetical protein